MERRSCLLMNELISLVIGYFLGNILFAMIVAKIFLHKDPTKYGSGNPGTANIGAVFGKNGVFSLVLET